MKNKDSVVNRFNSPNPLICEMLVKEYTVGGKLVNERSATVADLYVAAQVNNCIVITLEEYKNFVSYRDEYLAEKEKEIEEINHLDSLKEEPDINSYAEYNHINDY